MLFAARRPHSSPFYPLNPWQNNSDYLTIKTIKSARRQQSCLILNPLNSDTLGVHTLSLGVPLVVYLSTLVWETKGNEDLIKDNLIVSPKEVDILVENCAKILADAINALQ